MLTQDELADMLRDVSVVRVAELAQVSTKTVYRMRHKTHAPNLRTIEKLASAVRKLKALGGEKQ